MWKISMECEKYWRMLKSARNMGNWSRIFHIPCRFFTFHTDFSHSTPIFRIPRRFFYIPRRFFYMTRQFVACCSDFVYAAMICFIPHRYFVHTVYLWSTVLKQPELTYRYILLALFPFTFTTSWIATNIVIPLSRFPWSPASYDCDETHGDITRTSFRKIMPRTKAKCYFLYSFHEFLMKFYNED